MDEIIRRHCRSLKPILTGVEPVIRKLNVHAVLFDIYGTLLISASGDITTGQAASRGQAFVDAFAACCIGLAGSGDTGAAILTDRIAAEHARARKAGVEYPEVDMVDIWRQTVALLYKTHRIEHRSSDVGFQPNGSYRFSDELLQRLALHYELRVNPVWPMPHAQQCLDDLHDAGLLLGVVSNAQSLTDSLWRVLLDYESSRFTIDNQFVFYSYRYGQAKPGPYLFELAAAALRSRGIEPQHVLYIGNDMLNDIVPARAIGFQTALFAGDARSLRRRVDDSRVGGVTPDVTVTNMLQLIDCVVPDK